MSFNSEFEAVNVLEKNFSPPNFCKNNTLITREFSVGFGIADLVYFEMSKKRDSAINEPISSDSALSILDLFHHKDMLTIHQISSLVHLSVNTVIKRVRELVYLGYLESAQQRYRQKIKHKPIVDKIIAIEVKLSNWKRALIQAFKYTIFANQSYVAMDADYVHRAGANIDEFQKYNIGLLSITDRGEIESIFEPAWEPLNKDLSFLKVNERVKAFI